MLFVATVLPAVDFEFWLFRDFWLDVCFTGRAPIFRGYFYSLCYFCNSNGNIPFEILLYVCSHRVSCFGCALPLGFKPARELPLCSKNSYLLSSIYVLRSIMNIILASHVLLTNTLIVSLAVSLIHLVLESKKSLLFNCSYTLTNNSKKYLTKGSHLIKTYWKNSSFIQSYSKNK